MKAELKQRWLNALRSGNYQQGSGYLNRQERYCCLGVLCDVYSYKKVQATLSFCSYNGRPTNLDSIMLHEVGLTEANHRRLIRMNDGYYSNNSDDEITPQSFEVIADWIEANVPAT